MEVLLAEDLREVFDAIDALDTMDDVDSERSTGGGVIRYWGTPDASPILTKLILGLNCPLLGREEAGDEDGVIELGVLADSGVPCVEFVGVGEAGHSGEAA